MKKMFFAVLTIAALLSACGNNQDANTDSHTHEDGSVHSNHSDQSNTKPDQEHFDVEDEEINSEEAEHSHSHENEENHTH